MKKRILVVFPGGLVPAIMASQKITIEQTLAFARDHNTGVLTICRTQQEANRSRDFFTAKGIRFHYVLTSNNSVMLRKLSTFWCKLLFYLFGTRFEFSKNSSAKVVIGIKNIIEGNYDVVVANFWFGSEFLRHLGPRIYKVLYTHGLVEEFIELTENGFYHTSWQWQERRVYRKNLRFQEKIFRHVDLLGLNSEKTLRIAKERYPGMAMYNCPGGQDLTYYLDHKADSYDPYTVLFYGGLSARQNIVAFTNLYDNVWPLLKRSCPGARLLIAGSNPPDWLRKLSESENIVVPGFVEDIRKVIPGACCMILPMSIGVGFRSRVVEVMALGVPVIGNHNALDCLGMTNGVNGFVTDDYGEMATLAIQMMNDPELRNRIGSNGREFAKENFSIEATFGKVSRYLLTVGD